MVGNIFYRLALARRVLLNTFAYSGTPFHVSPAAGGGERDSFHGRGKNGESSPKTGRFERIGISRIFRILRHAAGIQNVVAKWGEVFSFCSSNSGNVALSA
jgi:hypothetical protein